ncbi:MORC family CW-type zinc finger protein 3a isoform X2 [Syngnathoides biaculeatus]|uniref:MORC family CW-type zinc finger protein 3a isoform X2 n=1 Tax=Syngnathoides biaculeatus TaxID=300417 RepID=UPI002ADD77B3|nr:MORC family CW-type zinc finger protein 3a isoform X2 [Syngnathoides biaculeatus]
MSAQQDRGVPLSTLSPKYLHTNSTSHTWPFSAIAELIDNAYDPDVLANAFWIDKTVVKGHDCLSFMDNGNGLDHEGMHKMLREEHRASLQDILRYSPFETETDLLTEISAITSTCSTATTGTRIIIWNLRRTSTGALEFDFQTDRYDIQIPSDVYEEMTLAGDRIPSHIPQSVYSLRAYCSILYLKPRMHVIIRGQKVKTQLIAKSLANSKTDHYKPISLTKRIPIIFGYNTKSRDHYGIMMYHKNRLIKAYDRIGCQLKPNSKGVGVIGVIECNFLEPMHNKQSFIENDKYRKTMTSLAIKLDEYCNEIRFRLSRGNPDRKVEVDDISKRPDQNWVMCDLCRKWRKLPDGIDCSRLPDNWFCHMNPDPQFRNCKVEEEAQDSDDDQPSYRKTYKQKEREDKKKLMSRQKVEADRRRLEEWRLAKLTLQNQALQEQEEELKRKLHQQTVHSPSTPTNSERRLNVVSVQETSSSPGVTAVSGTSPTSNGLPIISSVYSLSTSPSRKKRRMSAEPQSTPKSHRQNLFQPSESDASPSADVTPLRNEAFAPKMGGADLKGSFKRGSSSAPATPPGVSQMEAPRIKCKKEDEAVIKENPEQTENGAVATTDRGTQFSRMIKEENNSQSINKSDQTVYIDSDDDDDDDEIYRSLNWPTEAKEEQDAAHEERVQCTTPLSASCLHKSSQTEGRWPDKDYKHLFEKAEEKLNQLLRNRVDLFEAVRSEPTGIQAQKDFSNITLQIDALVRELDQRTEERNQLHSQLKSLKLQKENLSSQCQDLRTRLQQVEEKTQASGSRGPLQNGGLATQPASSPTNSDHFKRLVELRYNIGRLLVHRVPYLDLGQVNYECDVIDEILDQYLADTSSDRSDAPHLE